jgi:hypothetical protein
VEWLYLVMSYLSERVRQASIAVWSSASLAEVCQLDVDRSIVLEGTSVSHVNWIHHNITPGNHIVTVGVSPAILSEMWILGTSELGTDTYLGV